jgi:SOS-response transcriptional repressor LexA
MIQATTLLRMPKKPLKSKPPHGQALVMRRDELGISQDDVAERTGGIVYKQLMYRLENGLQKPSTLSYEQTLALAAALEWTVKRLNDILGVQPRFTPKFGDEVLDNYALPTAELRLPVVDAGTSLPVWDDTQETVDIRVPETQHRDPKRLFCVRQVGDSMRGYAGHGSTVVFDRDAEPQLGVVIAVHVPDDGLIIKRYFGDGGSGTLLLGNDNTTSTPRVFEAPEGASVYGVAIGRWDPG